MKTIAGMLITAGLFAAAGAQAQQTYTYSYTGQTLQNGTWGPTKDGGVPPAGNQVPQTLSGSITLSAPLNPNEANQIVTPLSWSFGTGTGFVVSNTFVQNLLAAGQTNPSADPYFAFSTANGQIIAWAWSIAFNYGSGAVTGSGTMTSVGDGGLGTDSWFGDPESGVSHCGYAYECDSYSAFVTSPGTWTSPITPNLGALYCTNGSNVYKVESPSNYTTFLLRPYVGTFVGQTCEDPIYVPSSWYIQVTANGGDSWYWVTLSSLNLGSN